MFLLPCIKSVKMFLEDTQICKFRLFNKIAASLNHRLYPSPEPPAGHNHYVHVQAGEVLLNNCNEGGLYGVGASIVVYFIGAPGPIVNSIKIGIV